MAQQRLKVRWSGPGDRFIDHRYLPCATQAEAIST